VNSRAAPAALSGKALVHNFKSTRSRKIVKNKVTALKQIASTAWSWCEALKFAR
jgi:hypothetical protein